MPSPPLAAQVRAQAPFDYVLVEGLESVALASSTGEQHFESAGRALESIGTITALTWRDAPLGTRALQVTGHDGALKNVQILSVEGTTTSALSSSDSVFELNARVRHDLANVLQAALLALDVPALTLAEQETQRQRIRSSLRGAQRVLDLLSRPSTHATHGPNPSANLASELHHVARSLEAVAESRRVELEATFNVATKIQSWAASELSAFFFNLGLNAVQAGRPGDAVRLSAEAGPESFEFTVSDTGPGIPDELKEAVWEGGVSTKARGSGIGLQIVKATTARLGGTLTCVTSTTGTTMRLVVPRARMACGEERENAACNLASEQLYARSISVSDRLPCGGTFEDFSGNDRDICNPSASGDARRVARVHSGIVHHAAQPVAWIIEDNPALCAMLSLILKNEGYDVRATPTLHQAYAQLDAISPSVVFVDRELPDGDGIALLKALALKRRNAQLIEMSGLDSIDHEGRWKFLRKPFDVDALIDLLPNARGQVALR